MSGELSYEEVFGGGSSPAVPPTRAPRGIRNNNPLNLKANVQWSGMAGTDGPFAVFDNMDDGIRAADRNLQTYGEKHGINTVAGVVNRWAPPTADGNNTDAYVQHVAGKLGVDPNAEIDMVNPATRQALIGGMAEFENGQPLPQAASAPAPAPAQEMSYEDVFGTAAPPPSSARPPPLPGQRLPQVKPRVDQGLGFQKGVMTPLDNGAEGLEWLAGLVGLDKPINALGSALGMPTTHGAMAERQQELGRQQAAGVVPGKIGEFAGNVAGTLPLGALRVGAAVQGALAGGLLTDAKDAKGIAQDVAMGGVAGKLGDVAMRGVGAAAKGILGKAPKVMDLPQLQAAKKAAYDAVDNSGFAFPRADVGALADDFAKTVGSSALSKAAKDDARSIIQYTRSLTKGDLPLSQLEKLRGDIYTAMVKKGGDTAVVGNTFRARIDDLIESTDDVLVRKARDMNTRWKKADLVSRKAKSGELRAEKDYGGDFGRKVKDRIFPLIDPDNLNANLRGTTADEKAALTKLATGTKAQNVASTVGGMLDPRRLGGKILTGMTATGGGATALPTGGLSLLLPAAQMAAGFGLTGASSRIARRNVDQLIRLIAAGGSKQALKKSPTAASRAAQKAATAARPAAGLIGGAAAAQFRGQ